MYFLVEKLEAFNFFKALNEWLKNKHGCLLSVFTVTEKESSFQKNSTISANTMGSRGR